MNYISLVLFLFKLFLNVIVSQLDALFEWTNFQISMNVTVNQLSNCFETMYIRSPQTQLMSSVYSTEEWMFYLNITSADSRAINNESLSGCFSLCAYTIHSFHRLKTILKPIDPFVNEIMMCVMEDICCFVGKAETKSLPSRVLATSWYNKRRYPDKHDFYWLQFVHIGYFVHIAYDYMLKYLYHGFFNTSFVLTCFLFFLLL